MNILTHQKPKTRLHRKLIWQVISILILFILISIAFSAVATYQSTMSQFMTDTEGDSRDLSHFIQLEMLRTPNIEWLVEYWKNNYESMDIGWDDQLVLSEKLNTFYALNPDLNLDNISPEQLSLLTDSSRKLYAEIAYMKLLFVYDDLKETYNPKYLYSFFVKETNDENSDQRVYLLTAKTTKETRGTGDHDIYVLGHTTPLDYEKHPVIKETIQTGIEQSGLEQSLTHETWTISTYCPLLSSEGDVLCIISVTMDAQELRDSLFKRVISIEILVIIIFAFSITAIILVMRAMVIKPIIDMEEGIVKFNNDMDSERLSRNMEKIKSKNELGLLASSMSNLGASLSYYLETVSDYAAKQERANTELSLAATIQNSSLPNDYDRVTSKWSDIRLWASMDPAKEVGGDFYDYIIIDDDHLALVIADVSGKGIPAALFMMVSKILIAESCEHTLHPADVLKNVNTKICEHNLAEMFVTVWLGILEISTGKVTASNAGHEYPIIKKANGSYELFKDKHSFVVGGLEMTNYKEYEFTLEHGDRLLVYTDGIAEATNSSDEQYGVDRLLNILNKKEFSSPEEVISEVTDDVWSFVENAEQFDDMTLLSLFYY